MAVQACRRFGSGLYDDVAIRYAKTGCSSLAPKSREFVDRVLVPLAPLVTEGLTEPCTDLTIDPGDHWDEKIAADLDRAQIILLLISADFLVSRYVSAVELRPCSRARTKAELG